MRWNISAASGAGDLSGCHVITALRYAFSTSSCEASGAIPNKA